MSKQLSATITTEETEESALIYVSVSDNTVFNTVVLQENPFVAIDVDKYGLIVGIECVKVK